MTSVSDLSPAIYVRTDPVPRMPMLHRLFALAIAIGAIGMLCVAVYLKPNAAGVGTHEQLGMQPCQFLYRTGLPCAGCGMTTSYAYFVRGQWIASFVSQPFGMMLALLTCATFWVGIYCAVTGKPSYRLLKMIPMKAHLWFWLGFGIFGWVWKLVAVIAAR